MAAAVDGSGARRTEASLRVASAREREPDPDGSRVE